jgi:hypothetical protein
VSAEAFSRYHVLILTFTPHCFLDDLGDAIRIFLGRLVVKLARKAGVHNALLQPLVVTGGEVGSFPDGASPNPSPAMKLSAEWSLKVVTLPAGAP